LDSEVEIKNNKLKVKSRTPNEQFATSGGATRPSGSAKQHLLALVRAFAIPPPAASCHHVVSQRGTAQRQHQAFF